VNSTQSRSRSVRLGRRACPPRVELVAGTEPLVSSAGGSLLVQAGRATGLDRALSRALGRWRPGLAVHDPGKILLDLACSLALGGDCLADLAVVRAQPAVFGLVASDPTVSRLVDRLAGDVDAALAAIADATRAARAAAWAHRCPLPKQGPVHLDLDATVIISHSEKQDAQPTFKRAFGFHPLLAFVDHGPDGAGGEALAGLLRPGNAGANTAADHLTVLTDALAQLPDGVRSRVVVRADSGGGTKEFLTHITDAELQYSIGMGTTLGVDPALLRKVPKRAWTPAYNSDGQPRDGAQVAELTGLLPQLLGRGWPAGMRVIARRERPHPGAPLRLTDHEGWRVTLFATNATTGQLAELELRHRLRARAEDRIAEPERPRRPQPPTARPRPEQDLARDRPTRPATAHLDRHPRPGHPPGRGAQTAPPAAAARRRPHHLHRPAHPATPSRPLALGTRADHRLPTAHQAARPNLTHHPIPTRNGPEHRRPGSAGGPTRPEEHQSRALLPDHVQRPR